MFNRGMNRGGAKAGLLVRRLVRFGSVRYVRTYLDSAPASS